ncbi:CRAL/TRIO domain-containing protein, partial [Piedraia hortae CBS 480.64]
NLITWPAGHVGHLSEDQQVALVRFKELAQQKGYYVPASETKPATHDDETLLRYLRARKYVPQDALGQFRDTEEWRKENQLDSLYETIDLAEYEASRRLYPQWTGRRDKRGVPVYVYAVAQVDSKDVNAASNSKEAKKANAANPNKVPRHMLVLFALYENLCRFVLPLCSAMPDRTHTESPISQSMNIVDLSGVGISKFWALKNHLSDASKLATAHYPETLDRIFVVGAPSFFPTVWDWTKKWFDPITVAKFSILSQKNLREQLEEHIHIDNIPVKYGGKLEWNFGDMPYLDPNIVQSMTWNEDTTEKGHRTLPKGPIKWQYDQDGSMVATAIGTVTGRPRASVIAGLRLVPGVAQLAL